MTTTTTIPGVTPVYTTKPRDLAALGRWLDVARRLRSVASTGTCSAIRIVIITDCYGMPIHWTEPKVMKIEPRADGEAFEALLSALAE